MVYPNSDEKSSTSSRKTSEFSVGMTEPGGGAPATSLFAFGYQDFGTPFGGAPGEDVTSSSGGGPGAAQPLGQPSSAAHTKNTHPLVATSEPKASTESEGPAHYGGYSVEPDALWTPIPAYTGVSLNESPDSAVVKSQARFDYGPALDDSFAQVAAATSTAQFSDRGLLIFGEGGTGHAHGATMPHQEPTESYVPPIPPTLPAKPVTVEGVINEPLQKQPSSVETVQMRPVDVQPTHNQSQGSRFRPRNAQHPAQHHGLYAMQYSVHPNGAYALARHSGIDAMETAYALELGYSGDRPPFRGGHGHTPFGSLGYAVAMHPSGYVTRSQDDGDTSAESWDGSYAPLMTGAAAGMPFPAVVAHARYGGVKLPHVGHTQVPMCRYFQQGYCRHGDRCNFAHTGEPLSETVPTPQSTAINENGYRSGRSTGRVSAGMRTVQPAGGKGHKRASSEGARYSSLDQVVGKMYGLCKDQHGCRFLQRKLEEQNERVVQAIFDEVVEHIVELMTDPFGNYLCQKLVEFCDDEQRTTIVLRTSAELVSISLNMHGTRAAQKLIECISQPVQISSVVRALQGSVVPLIKDLNGNHVIQRCLQRFSPLDNQFIYDAVASHCIEVATHRHGCCVIQRCVDYAADAQKNQLVGEITRNGLMLVQDAFGNYVVQYVLELKDPAFTDALIQRFLGNIGLLAAQKFSSNVIEKCVRVAEGATRTALLEEVIEAKWLPRLLQDPYGNYVIQTALSMCDARQFNILVEGIRPHLGLIRHTAYGKKIEAKLAAVSKWHMKK
eukprot:Opistho-2@63548